MTTSETVRDYGFLPADVRAFIDRTVSFDAPPGPEGESALARERRGYDAMCVDFSVPYPAGLTAEDLSIAGVPCRRYRPARAREGVTGLYIHGGGFVLGGLESHDSICADLADLAGVELIAIDYRLAPEHPHPAAYLDCCAVVDTVVGPKLLVGDSAGGLLAASVSAQRPEAEIRGQVLVYPSLGGFRDLPGMVRHAEAPLLAVAQMGDYARYFGAPADDPTGRPMLIAGAGPLPPTAVFAAGCDPLVSEAGLYARKLAAAGIAVSHTVEPDLIHGYLRARHTTSAGHAAFGRIAAALARLAEG